MRPDFPELAQVKEILAEAGVTGTVYVFGSRAKGTAHKHSDLDLLIDGPEPIPLQVLARLEVLLEESTLPFSVDVSDARRADPAFLAGIEADKVLL